MNLGLDGMQKWIWLAVAVVAVWMTYKNFTK
jgi:hypothetical protein